MKRCRRFTLLTTWQRSRPSGRGGCWWTRRRYNFSQYGDNPTYPGMFDAGVLVVGGSLMAADMILDGEVDAAFNPGGGLHHAAAGNTSGFCVFNDGVIAIKRMVDRGYESGLRGHRRSPR